MSGSRRWWFVIVGGTLGFVSIGVIVGVVIMTKFRGTRRNNSVSGANPSIGTNADEGSDNTNIFESFDAPTPLPTTPAPTGAATAAVATSTPTHLPEALPTVNPTPSPMLPITTTTTTATTTTTTTEEAATTTTTTSTEEPSPSPFERPSASPSGVITNEPTTSSPTALPSQWPTISPSLVDATYVPGDLTVQEVGLLLSTGLTARILAQSGVPVQYADGTQSQIPFHDLPDYGAILPIPSSSSQYTDNPDGYIYLINSEVDNNNGGVGAITFDSQGNVLQYQMLLTDTSMNCGGGVTPWNTFITCEEVGQTGQVYEINPFSASQQLPIARMTKLGGEGGRYESFASDVRNLNQPRFYISEDHKKGALRRFTPTDPDWNNPHMMLHGNGLHEFLVLSPNEEDDHLTGTFTWTTDKKTGQKSASAHFQNVEGIDQSDGFLYFVSKVQKELFTLDLDAGTYMKKTTIRGMFDGSPDQLQRLLSSTNSQEDDILYFTEEGGKDAGIHGRNSHGHFFTILEDLEYIDETTGLAFSPDAMFLFCCYQKNGICFQIRRLDGLPFHGRSLNVKYHSGVTNIQR